MEALGASPKKPAIVIGFGIGGMLTWYVPVQIIKIHFQLRFATTQPSFLVSIIKYIKYTHLSPHAKNKKKQIKLRMKNFLISSVQKEYDFNIYFKLICLLKNTFILMNILKTSMSSDTAACDKIIESMGNITFTFEAPALHTERMSRFTL